MWATWRLNKRHPSPFELTRSYAKQTYYVFAFTRLSAKLKNTLWYDLELEYFVFYLFQCLFFVALSYFASSFSQMHFHILFHITFIFCFVVSVPDCTRVSSLVACHLQALYSRIVANIVTLVLCLFDQLAYG
jgi:hypothetical protein